MTSRLAGIAVIVVAILCSVLLWSTVAVAQNAAEAKPTLGDKTSEAAPSPKGGVLPTVEDVIDLLGADGQLRRIPRWANFEVFEKWLKSREKGGGSIAPHFSFGGTLFQGEVEANDDTATLSTIMMISLNPDETDVLVPLRLNEATLLKFEHVGTGGVQFEDFDREAGYRCWLRGKGQHELKLTLSVPIRKQGATRRVLLSLPTSPVNEFKLNIPLAKVSAKGPDRSVVTTKPLDNGRSEIHANWLGNLLDLSWQSVTDISEAKPELQAITVIAADLRADSLVLEATQTIGSIQGTFERITVRLPAEFEFIEVVGRDVKDSQPVPGSPTRRVVNLLAPTSGKVELKWTLKAKIPANAKSLPAIEGFEVEEARRQTGVIPVMTWDGVTLRKRDGEDRFLHPGGLNDLRDAPGFSGPTGSNGITMVYRFLKQPFRLMLDVQKIEPYFSVEPLHVVRLSLGQAELETKLKTRVYRGSLHELLLSWPGFQSEGWEAISSSTPELVEKVVVEETPAGSAIRVHLVDRKGRSDGEFEIRLKAKRIIPTDGKGTEFKLSLPFTAASGQRASKVIVAPAGNLEVEWTSTDTSLSRPMTPDIEVLDVLESTRTVTAWRWESGSPSFVAKAKVQQQSIRTESASELTFDSRTFGASQRITYEVAFEALNQIRLMVPRSIADRVKIQLREPSGNSKPLTPIFTGLEIDHLRQCRLQFDEPQLGKVEVLIEFEMDRPNESASDDTSVVNVPIVQSSDADFTSTRVKWKTGERFAATLEDNSWKPELPELSASKMSLWKVTGAKNAVAVRISSAAELTLQDFTVHNALIRTVMNEGPWRTQAMFELDRDVREVSLFLPSEISPQDFHVWWNRKRLVPIVRTSPAGEVELRLKLPHQRDKGKKSENHEANEKFRLPLLIDYSSKQPTHFRGSNEHRIVVPSFAPTVWVAQTIWEIALPPDQHLFTTPRDYATQFHWTRSFLFWNRVSNYGGERIKADLNSAAPLPDELRGSDIRLTEQPDGNVYSVSCFGPPQPLAFWTMSRSAVVGCGAGLALLLGFLLIRIPATRHVLTFFVIGFVMSLTALWFAEPVKVLLQPAILGAMMAVVAAIIDRVGRRQQPTSLMTLSSPSDFYAVGSSVVPKGGVVSAEAPTVAPHVKRSEPTSASGSGNRG
ncbi:MAG: hypothetical protein NT013_21775 [Planctomycetia bacterium]|nr:hypothetical protein [Planctomycetia bacterium]